MTLDYLDIFFFNLILLYLNFLKKKIKVVNC